MQAAQGRPRTVPWGTPRAWAVWEGGHMHRERGQAQCGWDTASTHQCYLFAASLPPHSTTEKVSLKKKKKSTTTSLVWGQKSDTEETNKQKKLKREPPWKWPHTDHNTRESPRNIFTIFTTILFFCCCCWCCCLIVFSFLFFFSFFKLFFLFLSPLFLL